MLPFKNSKKKTFVMRLPIIRAACSLPYTLQIMREEVKLNNRLIPGANGSIAW
jgi:hypothetical protein